MTNNDTDPLNIYELHPRRASCIRYVATHSQERATGVTAPLFPDVGNDTPQSNARPLEAQKRSIEAAWAVPEQAQKLCDVSGQEVTPPLMPAPVAPTSAPATRPSARRYPLPEPTLALPPELTRRLRTRTSRDFAKMPRQVPLVGNVFHGGEVIMLWGESQAGKTVLGLDLAGCISSGTDWAGHPVTQTNVVYLAREGQIGLRTRFQALEHYRGVGPNDGVHFAFDPCNIADEEDVNALALAALQHKAKCIFIDTLSASIAGAAEENSNSAMAGVIANMQRLTQLTGAAVVIVHHTGNDPKRGARGAYALHANPDVSIEVSCSGEERYWRLAKSRDGKPGIGGSFKIKVVTFQPAHEDEPLESIVVQHLGREGAPSVLPASARATKAQGRADKAMDAIRANLLSAFGVDGQPASSGMSYGEACKVVTAAFEDMGSKHRARYVRDAIQALVDSGRLLCEAETVRLPG